MTGLTIQWGTTLSSFLMNIFFTCMGFGFSFKHLQKGKKYIIPIFATITAIVFIQGFIGLGAANFFDLHPLLGVNATTGAHAGGPGTAAAFGEIYEQMGAEGTLEAGIASATVGLALGSLLGGPTASFIIRRLNLKANPADVREQDTDKEKLPLDTDRLFRSVAMILIIAGLGVPIYELLNKIPMLQLPYFIGISFRERLPVMC